MRYQNLRDCPEGRKLDKVRIPISTDINRKINKDTMRNYYKFHMKVSPTFVHIEGEDNMIENNILVNNLWAIMEEAKLGIGTTLKTLKNLYDG